MLLIDSIINHNYEDYKYSLTKHFLLELIISPSNLLHFSVFEALQEYLFVLAMNYG